MEKPKEKFEPSTISFEHFSLTPLYRHRFGIMPYKWPLISITSFPTKSLLFKHLQKYSTEKIIPTLILKFLGVSVILSFHPPLEINYRLEQHLVYSWDIHPIIGDINVMSYRVVKFLSLGMQPLMKIPFLSLT
jgi:hypothetical protein